MKHKTIIISLTILIILLLGVGLAGAQEPEAGSDIKAQANVGIGFTYQGRLTNGGSLVNDNCDLIFKLFDQASDGIQIGSDVSRTATLTDGYFIVTDLDFENVGFGDHAFTGEARWLQIDVRCPAGSGGYTTLSPRQELTPAPYALALPGLRTQQKGSNPPNMIGGYIGNIVAEGVVGATISGGGGINNLVHEVKASYATIGGGIMNFASGGSATISGGGGNYTSGDYATIPGGTYNTASGDYSFAAGRQAKAQHDGTFVWADSTEANFSSTKQDQFAIRATNGVRVAVNAGDTKAVAVGERYRDNGIIAWAKVNWDGSSTSSFGVESVTRSSTGHYAITITAQTGDAALLIPMAIAEIDAPPINVASVRIVSVDQIGPSTFNVYINNGIFALVDNDFVFMVTGR